MRIISRTRAVFYSSHVGRSRELSHYADFIKACSTNPPRLQFFLMDVGATGLPHSALFVVVEDVGYDLPLAIALLPVHHKFAHAGCGLSLRVVYDSLEGSDFVGHVF
jgi:hypothetical protein